VRPCPGVPPVRHLLVPWIVHLLESLDVFLIEALFFNVDDVGPRLAGNTL